MPFAFGSPIPSQTVPDSPGAAPWAPAELRLVCLDIDDTLIDFSAAGRRSLAALIGHTDVWPLWERITDQHVARVVAGDLHYAHMHTQRSACFLAELGLTACYPDAAAFETERKRLLHENMRLFDDVLPCLDWLVAAGVRLAAVTNASGAHQREKIADLGLARFFDHVAIAGEVGVAKPDPVMFHSVCLAVGCDPSEAVHVGDKLGTDAVGARDAGLCGVWLDRVAENTTGDAGSAHAVDEVEEDDEDDAAEGLAPGVQVVRGLDELPELLVSEFARVGVPVQR